MEAKIDPPSKIVIVEDTREQYPLLFPATVQLPTSTGATKLVKIETRKQTLPVGDYLLEGYSDVTIIERKGSASEVATNLGRGDRQRAVTALRRLARATRWPLLLLDFNPTDFIDRKFGQTDGLQVLHDLLTLADDLQIRVVPIGARKTATARRKAGAFAIHLMAHRVFTLGNTDVSMQGATDGCGVQEGPGEVESLATPDATS